MSVCNSKVISISDIINWYQRGELELSPKYQRNKVWNNKAKSYLMDTILRGLPIPPIFIRQHSDSNTMITFREIVDGQQRIRTIIEFILDKSFSVTKNQNPEFGGILYSDLDNDVKEKILDYEIIAQVITTQDDGVIYDMFARLNSNNIVLNKQEIRNAKYWGVFKVLVYETSSRFRDFILNNKLFKEKDIARMADCELFNSLYILMINGIVDETPQYVDKTYETFDNELHELDSIKNKINFIMELMQKIYSSFYQIDNCFTNKNFFYCLFSFVYHQTYGIKNMEHLERLEALSYDNISNHTNELIKSVNVFAGNYSLAFNEKDFSGEDYIKFKKFKDNNTKRTTSKKERIDRISFLNSELISIYVNFRN